jgi:hypothetical protein
MTFELLNEGAAAFGDQAEVDAGDIAILAAANRGTGVYSGCDVLDVFPADGTVNVVSGSYRVNGSTKTLTGGLVKVLAGSANTDGSTSLAADDDLPRYDLIVADSSSHIGVIHGDTTVPVYPNYTVNPVYPAFSATTQCVLAAIYIPPATSAIDIAMITQKGVPISVNAFHDQAHSISGANHTGSITTAQGLGKPQALTGAVSATNYVGGTAAVAPTTGTFAVGDFVITQTGKIYICTVAGTPGTWVQSGGGLATDPLFTAAGELVQGTGTATAAALSPPTAYTATLGYNGTAVEWRRNRVWRSTDSAAKNNSTLANDDTLLWAIGTGSEVWFFQAFLILSAANTTMDAKFGFSVPASTTMLWGANATANTANLAGYTSVSSSNSPAAMLTESGAAAAGSVAGNFGVSLGGVVFGSTTAGNVALQWAQNTTDAGDLILKKGSMLLMWRLA